MSLLMDALKRAEKAREAQAEKATLPGDSSFSSELSLDPMEDLESTSLRQAPASALAGTGTEDSLELTPNDIKLQIDTIENSELDEIISGFDSASVDEQQPAPSPPFDDSLALEYGDIPLDETGSTLPSARAAQRSVQDYFDGTHSMSMSMDEVRETIDSKAEQSEQTETLEDVDSGGATTSQRRAQAVIDARQRAPSRTGRNVALLLVFLLLLGGIGGTVFMFKDSVMAMLGGQAPLVAQRPPPQRIAQSAATAAPTASGAKQNTQAAEREALLRAAEKVRAEQTARVQAQADLDAKLSAAQHIQAKALAEAAATQAKLEAELATLRETVAEQSASAAAANIQRAQAVATAAAANAAPSAFKISKRRGPGRTQKKLISAFELFQRGDDRQAMNIYSAVLKREPRNRDALLGAAAVSMRAGAHEKAASYYAQVLRRNPRDGAAQAGLMALRNDTDPIAGESRIKDLLIHTPADSNLHFTLGNSYAEQGRWPEAQQSYFEAYRLDSSNPDYAFNLAVSLDQLAQSKSALEYYRRAEQLAGELPAAFDLATAQRRAAQLAGS